MAALPTHLREYRESDWNEWLRLTQALFPDHPAVELAPDMRAFRARVDTNVFVIERPDGSLAGYVQGGAGHTLTDARPARSGTSKNGTSIRTFGAAALDMRS